MTKFKVIRYWDTYPDGVVAIQRKRQKRYVMNIVEAASLCTTI